MERSVDACSDWCGLSLAVPPSSARLRTRVAVDAILPPNGTPMRYVRIDHDGAGGSRSADVEVALQKQPFAAGVPPLLVSSAVATGAAVFVEFPADVRDTVPHPTPRRQFAVILRGVVQTETTDGEVRRFTAGSVVLLEDTEGIGHVTTVLEPPLEVLFVPLDGEA
jgi:hypothetical protein